MPGMIIPERDQYGNIINPKGEVTPTTPKNEHDLQPFGDVKAVINASTKVFTATLTLVSGNTYSYSGASGTPEAEGFVCQSNFTKKCMIQSVDSGQSQLTLEATEAGQIGAGACTICNPVRSDYVLPRDGTSILEIWGIDFVASDNAPNDFARMQIVHPTYGVVVGEYEQRWIENLKKNGNFKTPDGAPAVIPDNFIARLLYIPTDASKTNTELWYDYWITEMST